jgi:hypothetical protein
MQATILCLECNKQTVHFELGQILYCQQTPTESFLVKNRILCPKCKKDVSDQRFAIGERETLMQLIVVNMLMASKEPVPSHLRGVILATRTGYDQLKADFYARPKLVDSLQRTQREKR